MITLKAKHPSSDLWHFLVGSSLGKPRRLSAKFLEEERRKLVAYRENARQHYQELRAGLVDSLPADLAKPLMVGQRVTARHPRSLKFDLADGSILTVDKGRCRVQFDRPELGVELVQVGEKLMLQGLLWLRR